ncbi:type VI secretion system ImpA domain-containing protein [Pandoraea bronchicola]|uniref:Type VI secretion system ImpA domain-containing protein n=2 Tax=Pandoraea bronchicola TaxID=2508287 RepID=A0A5E5BRV3_9BURK|nr:type VI secretion system protein TssA [Pandoraea bronchicola]VVE88364.1 type VI secretion system ImpA domain-containing protein [Pandoraea bronchicola]
MLAGLLNRLIPSIRHAEQFARTRLDAWSEWLHPLSGKSGAGRDPGYEDAFFAIKDESGKLGGIDDALIMTHCERLTTDIGKDLRVAGYYAAARLRRDGTAGFADGLELAAALVDRFGDGVLPARVEARKGALEMLVTPRVLECLSTYEGFAAADRERALAALDVLLAHIGSWPDNVQPNLQALVTLLEGKDTTDAAGNIAIPAKETPPTTLAAPTPTAIHSSRDMLEQARVMANWLRDQDSGYLSAARMVRSVRWDTLQELPPADNTGQTRLAPPRAELRQHLKRLVLQKQWIEVLERVEDAYLEGANHYWLDLQYFQHMALERAGHPYDGWRDVLRTDVALFLERLPDIERLTFNDRTPFANDATLDWLATHAVVRNLAAGEGPAPLPVTAGGNCEGVGDWPEIEAQAREKVAIEGLEAAIAWLEALPGMTSQRHRFLQRLLMARVAEQASRSDTAIALLTELDASARAISLAQWEPALAFEVKQQLARGLKTVAARKDVDRVALIRRMADLQAEMTVLDPARALANSQHAN